MLRAKKSFWRRRQGFAPLEVIISQVNWTTKHPCFFLSQKPYELFGFDVTTGQRITLFTYSSYHIYPFGSYPVTFLIVGKSTFQMRLPYPNIHTILYLLKEEKISWQSPFKSVAYSLRSTLLILSSVVPNSKNNNNNLQKIGIHSCLKPVMENQTCSIHILYCPKDNRFSTI